MKTTLKDCPSVHQVLLELNGNILLHEYYIKYIKDGFSDHPLKLGFQGEINYPVPPLRHIINNPDHKRP